MQKFMDTAADSIFNCIKKRKSIESISDLKQTPIGKAVIEWIDRNSIPVMIKLSWKPIKP